MLYMCDTSCIYWRIYILYMQVSVAADSIRWLFAWRLWALRCRGWAEREIRLSWRETTWACSCRGILHLPFIYVEMLSHGGRSCSVLLRLILSSSFRQNQQGLAQLVEKELKKVSQQLDMLSRLHHPESHMLSPLDALSLHTGEALILYLLKTSSQRWGQSTWIAL